MKINYTTSGNSVEVKLIGELDTPATVEIQPSIDKILGLTSKDIVIDCSKLEYIASSGLRQLISIHKNCKSNGGSMCLSGVTPDIMEIFTVTGFDKVFDIR